MQGTKQSHPDKSGRLLRVKNPRNDDKNDFLKNSNFKNKKMSKLISILFLLFYYSHSYSQLKNPDFRNINNGIFKAGETFEWLMYYGPIDAGTARLELKDEGRIVNGRKVLHAVGIGKSQGMTDWFFKVRDRYESYLDADGVFPYLFVRRVDEGGYLICQDYKFLQQNNQVDNGNGKIFDTPQYIQDMISAFYFARTIDFSGAKKGDVFTVNTFVDDTIFPVKIRFVGIENIEIKLGTFSCMKFHPVLQKGRIFKDEDDLNVWITNDVNKIPILTKADVLIGSIKMELRSYSGLCHPISKVK